MTTIKYNTRVDISDLVDVDIDLIDFLESLDESDLEKVQEFLDNNYTKDDEIISNNLNKFDYGNKIPEHCIFNINNLYEYQKMKILIALFKECNLEQLEKLYEGKNI